MSAIYYNGIAYANGGGGGGGGVSDYSLLTNKPQINGNVLTKDTVASQLDLVDDNTLEVKENKIKIKNLPSMSGDVLSLTF